MRKPFKNILLVLGSLVLAFCIIELGYIAYLRVVTPITVYHPLGKALSPNGKGDYRGGYVSLDKYALRNPTDVNDRRIKFLVVGDSLTFGMGVDDGEVFTHHLNRDAQKFDIGFINLGYPGFDTYHLVRHFFKKEKFFRPYDAIIWVYYINDAKNSRIYMPWKKIPHPDFRWGPYEFENTIWPYLKSPTLIKHLVMNLISKLSSDKASEEENNDWDFYYKACLAAYNPGNENAENEKKFLKDIIDFSRERDVPVLFVLAPATDQFRDRDFRPQIFILNTLLEYDTPILNLFPVFDKFERVEDFYLEGDHGHWNAKGHKVVAGEIKNFVTSIFE